MTTKKTIVMNTLNVNEILDELEALVEERVENRHDLKKVEEIETKIELRRSVLRGMTQDKSGSVW